MRHGFTLVELLVVMGIIMVLMAVAMPIMSMFGKAQALSSGGNAVVSAFQLARSEAISKHIPHGVIFLEEGLQVVRLSDPPAYVGSITKLPKNTRLVPWCAKNVDQYKGDPQPKGLALVPDVVDAAAMLRQGFYFSPLGDLNADTPYTNITPGKINGEPFDFMDENEPIQTVSSKTTVTDIVVEQEGNRSQRCFVDLPRSGGGFRFRLMPISEGGKEVQ